MTFLYRYRWAFFGIGLLAFAQFIEAVLRYG